MAETNEEVLGNQSQSEDASSDSLDLNQDELSEVFDSSPDDARIESNDSLGLIEDFSLESEGTTGAEKHQTQSHNIELLMDVELNVVIELGRTRKTIRDILHFGPGSVIELDKMAGETVDVFINDRLIAQGEVILFEDSLGVRITSITSTEELIKRLGK